MTKKGMKRKEIPLAQKMACGIAVSFLLTLACSMVFAMLISSEVIREDNTVYCVGTILLLSTGIGAYVATSNQKENKLYKSLLFGSIYTVLLLAITTVVFGAAYRGVWVTAILILCGCIVPAILRKRSMNSPKSHRGKMRCC